MNLRSKRIASVSAGVMLAMSIGALSVPAASAATPSVNVSIPASAYSDSFAKQTFDLMNVERAKVGSKPLVWNQKIADVSQAWANQTGIKTQNGTFDWATIHRADAGGSLIPSGATMYREIIGFNFTPAQIVQWWMGSPGHKAAMLHPSATDAGIGYVVPTSGPYAGWHLVVSNLAGYSGTQAPAPVAPTPIPAPTPPPAAATAPILPASTGGSVLKAIDPSGTLWDYKAPGNKTLGARTLQGTGWSNAKQIISTDWNGDGKLDIVARWGNGYLTMYAGIGGDDYKAPINIGSGFANFDLTPSQLRKADTKPGLVARGISDGNLYYYPNTTGGAITAPRIQLGTGGWQAMSELNALDVDKDGNMDLLARNSAGELRLYRSNGAGTIYNEARKLVSYGWNTMNSISAEPNFAGAGTVGLIARHTDGRLFYYPVTNGTITAPTALGSGWSGYNIAAGTIK